MAAPKDANPPLAVEVLVQIDPRTPHAGTVELSTATFVVQFLAMRTTLQQLRDQLSVQLEQAPISPDPHVTR